MTKAKQRHSSRFSTDQSTQAPGGKPQAQPAREERHTAQWRDDAQLADAGECQQVQAAREQHDTQAEQAAGPAHQAPGELRGKQRYRQQGQGVNQLIRDPGLKDRQVLTAQACFQAVGGKGAKGDTGKTEKGSEQQETTKHKTTPSQDHGEAEGLYNGPLHRFGQAISPMLSSLLRRLTRALLWFAAGSALLVLLFRWVPPPGTALMVERKVASWFNGQPIDLQRDWQPWEQISDDLKVAVIAGEDQKFPEHWGFDFTAIQAALAHNERGGSIRGASTLSQQVAKNLFLWSGRSWLRKGLEAWFTALIEVFWSKERILEVYLNSAEWDDGVFGAQAAARHHFGVNARNLSQQQASLLAAVLPSPRKWSASHPSSYVARRASWIRQQMRQLGGSSYLSLLDSRRAAPWNQ